MNPINHPAESEKVRISVDARHLAGNQHGFLLTQGSVIEIKRRHFTNPQNPNDHWWEYYGWVQIPGCPLSLYCRYDDECNIWSFTAERQSYKNHANFRAWLEANVPLQPLSQSQSEVRRESYFPPGLKREYISRFREFCSIVQTAASPYSTLTEMDNARHALASRADMLIGRQRCKYVASRAQEIQELHQAYDRLVQRMIASGWK